MIRKFNDGFGVDDNSQQEILKNQIYAMVQALSYTFMCRFKDVLLLDEAKRWEAYKVYRKLINVPENVVDNGRPRHIRLTYKSELEPVLSQVQDNLRKFIWFVKNGFNPLVPATADVEKRCAWKMGF